jgi:exodeoxyribonuclease VII small subunit
VNSHDLATIKFESALAEIDKILRELEDGTTSLEDSLARYERGIALLRTCYKQLQDAEQTIRQLSSTSTETDPKFIPFEHTSAMEKRPRKPTPPVE